MKNLTIILSLVLSLMVMMYYCDNTTTGVDDDIIITTATITPTIINNPTIEPTVIIATPTPEPTAITTTYQIYNDTGYTLDNLYSYYYDGSNVIDLTSHGDLLDNAYTDKIETDNPTIKASMDIGSETCITTVPFEVIGDINNVFTLTGTTKVFCN